MKKNFLIIAAFLVLSTITYYVDYLIDGNDMDCFDDKFNHVLIFAGY